MDVALEFAYMAACNLLQQQKEGETKGLMVPVLFVLDIQVWGGNFKSYLNTDDLSAFPEEEEVLVRQTGWKVSKIEREKTLMYNGNTFPVTMIYLNDGY